MIDAIDRQILTILQDDARIATAEIARRVEMAPSAVHERIRKLEDRGIIRGYEARIDPTSVGFGLLAFVFVGANEGIGAPETEDHLASIPEVQEVHHVAGEDCFLVKVRAPDTESLGRLLRSRFGDIPGVDSTRTTIVLETTKETGTVPVIPSGPTEDAERATDRPERAPA